MKNKLVFKKLKFQTLLLILLFTGIAAYSQNGCPEIPKSALNGFNGFSVTGKTIKDDLGQSVKSAGDINHDGIPDIMIGAPGVDVGGIDDVGEIYVIYGKAGLSINTFDVTTLDGTNGFVIRGTQFQDNFGAFIGTAGDFNNDGIDDIIIGSKTGTQATAFVLFGSNAPFPAIINKTDLNASNGAVLNIDSLFGPEIVDVNIAGDLNHDAISDIIITVKSELTLFYFAVFGKSGIPNINTSALNGTNGFLIKGYNIAFLNYYATAKNAGDVNNDGIDDLILGIPNYSETGFHQTGRTVIWYGKNTYAASYSLDAMNATDGTVMKGTEDYEYLGLSVSAAGDFNKDGIDDILIGSPRKTLNGLSSVGEAYAIFGTSTPFPASFTSAYLNTGNSVIFKGKAAYEEFGIKVNSLKDINNDAKDDIIIVSKRGGKARNGAAYVVFGGTTAAGVMANNQIFGSIGYQVFNDENYSSSYFYGVDAGGIGDFNADGTNDFAIGSIRNSTYYWNNGDAYVFYAEKSDRTDSQPPTISCPMFQELYANAALPNYVHFLQDVKDNCTDAQDLFFTQSPPMGTLFTADTNVTITAKDKSGNTASCTFLVKKRTTVAQIDCATSDLSTSNLDGTNGFAVYGEKAGGAAGSSANTIGDINGDGNADFMVGAPGGNDSFGGQYYNDNRFVEGAGYVVYGTASGYPPLINLALLNGTNGFAIRNDTPYTNYPVTGYDVSGTGDINGDGIDDFMISDAYRATSYGPQVGHVYVIFGKTSGFPANFMISSLNGNNGFILIGENAYGALGTSITAIGDINGDGLSDIAAIDNASLTNGNCFVIYGSHTTFPAILRPSQLNGINGFRIAGDALAGKIGNFVAGLGDVNGDGIPDIGVGSANESEQGKKFVIYGLASNFPATFSISEINGTNGFSIQNSTNPITPYYGLAKAGDINGDGFNDIAIVGEYILFGGTAIPANMDLKDLNGTNGFKIINSFANVFSGGFDFNADGFDDFAFSAGNSVNILYGKSTWNTSISANFLTAKEALNVVCQFGNPEDINFAGDLNHDGIDDIIIGAVSGTYKIEPNKLPGFAFVVYGTKIKDTQKPVITNCPTNKILAVGTTIPDYKTTITVTDNCDNNPVIEQTPAPGTIFTGGTQTITLKATDASSLFEICTFTISETGDVVPPVLTCPGNQQLPCGSLVPDYFDLLTVTDDSNLDIDLTQTPGEGSTFYDGMEIEFTATDQAGNESKCSIIVTTSGADTTPPTFDCPMGLTLNCGDLIPNYAEDPMMNLADNCSDNVHYVMTPGAGTPFYDGISINIIYTDESGNSADCNFTVHAANPDVTKPVITCIANQTLSCGTILPDYRNLVSATDNCGGTPIITQNPAAGSIFTSGMTVTLTATDASGNQSSCSFIVNASADDTKPVISCIGNQTLSCGTTIPDYTALISVADNCDTALTLAQNPIAGSDFTNGMTITITATDISGNYENCSFIVNASADATKPVLTCIGNQTLSCGSTIPDYTALISVTDNCDATPALAQNPAAGSAFTDGMTITITATDVSGNYENCSFIVNASADAAKPLMTCIGNQTLSCGTTIPDYTALISVTDNCDAAPTLVQNPVAGSAFTDGMTITITASDISGNYENCSFIINASADAIKPVINCIGNQTLSCGSTIPDYTPLVTANDNCDAAPVMTQNPPAGSVFTDGMTITITAKDASGNKSDCFFQVNSSLVLVDAGNDVEITEGESVQLEAVATEEGTFKWNSSNGIEHFLIANPFVSPTQTTIYKVLFKSKNGCEAQDEVLVSVIPKVKDETKYGFSPNNDGINDYWFIDHITEYPNNKVSVYNRWGDLVYEATGYNNATNVFNGIANKSRNLGANELPEGTYFFEINPNAAQHNFKKLRGYLVLKR